MRDSLNRPVFREIFLLQDKRLEIFFYTSNLTKFLHARTVFQQHGLFVGYFKSRSEPYSEDYSRTKEELLARAIEEIRNTVGSASLFFVEDTSVRIDALSEAKDFPGLAVKEWFATTSFDDVDAQLRTVNKGRRATIHSCIALHVPKLAEPVFFEGHTNGIVADTPPSFEENPQHPWLTPNSFNGWFIPEGSNKRLGEMSFEESWQHDFRSQSLKKLIDRLEEYQAVLNLPPHAYVRANRVQPSNQGSLFPKSSRPVFIIVGYPCAGKTTFGEYASARHSLQFIEASSIVRTFKNTSTDKELDSYKYARNVLASHGPDAVAVKIVQLYAEEDQEGLVISGFRTIEEVEVLRKHYPQSKLIWIESSERTRFERYLVRARDEVATNLQEFRRLDSQQAKFGLLRVAQEFADVRIVNEGDLENYRKLVDAVITGAKIRTLSGIATNVQPRHNPEHNQLYECLYVLKEAGRPLTCDEIQDLTKARGHEIRHNNANKVLKRVPELVRRWELEGNRVRYEIQNPGRAYIRLMDERIARNSKENRKRK